MARPRKNTVDYFPHYCAHKRTMFILEQRYGNDGYAFWFKLLEELGAHENHVIDLREPTEVEFLGAKTRLSADKTIEILDLLAKLEAIDSELWSSGIVWSANFVDNIVDAYRKRNSYPPSKPTFQDGNIVYAAENRVSGVGNPQTILNNTKQYNKASNNSPPRNDDGTVTLHDNTRAVLKWGVWHDADNPTVTIDIGHYPELKTYQKV